MPAKHRTVVPVVHDAVPHTTEPSVAETVESLDPKLIPVSVTDESCDIATFADRPFVSTGASYVKPFDRVPTALPTLSAPNNAYPVPLAGRHSTLESVLHAVVKQPLLPSVADGVVSAMPKLSPDRVSEMPALVATLLATTLVATGASNVRAPCCVPTTPFTVTAATAKPLPTDGPVHSSDVPVVHATVEHTPTLTTLAVAVKSATPNDKPEIVKLPPPVVGMFALHTRVIAGAANASRCAAERYRQARTQTGSQGKRRRRAASEKTTYHRSSAQH